MRYEELKKKAKEIGLTYDECMELYRLDDELWNSWYNQKQIILTTLERHKQKMFEWKKRIEKHNPHIIPREEVFIREDDILD